MDPVDSHRLPAPPAGDAPTWRERHDLSERVRIAGDIHARLLPVVADRPIRPHVQEVAPIENAARALLEVAAAGSADKIVLDFG
ncbi:hypothetical protein ACWDKQ_11970 [Saccharopolyspora sp. NPDC000995]